MPQRHTFGDEPELCAFAAVWAARLNPGDVVALNGPLGSGKTTFVRAVVRALQGRDPVSSPTFTFWHRYTAAGAPIVDHLDLYRVRDPSELAELGLEEAFAGDSIVLVEWSEHAPTLLPEARFEVCIAGVGDGARTLELRRTGGPG